ncbi:SCA7, zinc-binding domain-containing protein [Phyllosticta citribraziliensis]|uniref:SCA7, zinc-binding domain-containing protein n=1 Tax=Phyllosticta citribraziliensis TaxID=989973 RepID=A0ABR1L4T7_9PEZI
MVANGARKTPTAPGSMGKQGLVDAHAADAVLKDKERKPLKIKLKQSAARQTQPGNWKESEIVDANNKKIEAPGGSTSPLVNSLNEHILAAFTTNRPLDDQLDTVQCRHCRRPVLRTSAKDHIRDCLDKKQAKLKKKKEAKEAKEAAIRREKGLPSEDEGPPKNARKSAKGALEDHTGAKKTKKRKADGDAEKAPATKKKKKDEPKAKQAKAKGPVDVEKQCGVLLPNGSMCARSLTCKSHSMGAKRAVPGRSLPYDMLLAQYQKKNQAKQQRAAIDANAPLADDFDNHAPIDSDEEKDAIMAAIVRSRPAPLVTRPLIATRSKYQNVRIKEMLQQSMGGRNGSGLFSTGAPPPPPSTASTDPHTMPSSSSSSTFPPAAYRGLGLLGAIFGEPHQPPPLMTPGGAGTNSSSSANATAAAAAAAAAGPGSAMGLGAGDDVAAMGLSSANAAAVAARRQSNMGNVGGGGGGGPRQILPGQLPGPSPNTSGGGGGGGSSGAGGGGAGGGSRKTSLNAAGMGGVNGVAGVGVG